MIPILFEPKTENYNTNGIGRLSDAISCVVTEERNGIFELEMQYPITGVLYDEIKNAAEIYADPGTGRTPQAFGIYKISKPLNGIVTIYASHKSYQLSHVPCSPFKASNVVSALDGLKENAAVACPFEFWTDKMESRDFTVSVPSSIRSKLGGSTGSILDVYGGEFAFEMNRVLLYANRGKDNGVVLKYGKNITDLKQEENIQNTITGIYPFWAGSDGDRVELPEKVLLSDASERFPYPRVIPIDFTSEFQEKPSVDVLRNCAETYMREHDVGIPAVNISVCFEALWQSDEYAGIASLERVNLCDIVTVEYERLGVQAKAKVIKTVYDVLKDKYQKIEIGEAKSTMADTLLAQTKAIQDAPSRSFLAAAVKQATDLITGVSGGYVVFHQNADGKPYEILIMDTPDIETATNVWRWNQNGLGHSESGYAGPYSLAMTIDGGIVADFITAGTMMANRIKGGTLTLGGNENGNGELIVKNASGETILTLEKEGIVMTMDDGSKIIINPEVGFYQLVGSNKREYHNLFYSTEVSFPAMATGMVGISSTVVSLPAEFAGKTLKASVSVSELVTNHVPSTFGAVSYCRVYCNAISENRIQVFGCLDVWDLKNETTVSQNEYLKAVLTVTA